MTTSSGTETFATVASTQTNTFSIATAATRTQQAARYLADDLRGLIDDAGIDLALALGIPPDEAEYLPDSDQLAELICNDIEQMLLDRLITGAHFMLCESKVDTTTNAYNVKYHVEYTINIPQRSLTNDVLNEFGGRLTLPKNVGGTRFVLLIDWDRSADREEIKLVERPRYFFDWHPPVDRYDASSLVHYHTGGLDTIVVRRESANANNIP